MKTKLTLFLLFNTVSLFSQSTPNYNKKGMDAYLKKDYQKAIEYFSETLKSSPNDAYANYNLACTYAILINQCEDVAGDDQIYKLIEKAIQNKPSYKNKLLKDEDFVVLRGKYLFQKTAGKTKKEILSSIVWYGPSPGAYGPIDQFQFKEDGTFIYSKLNLEEIAGGLQRDEFKGSYTWETDHAFQIRFEDKAPLPDPKSKRKTFRVKYSEGLLEIQDFDHVYSDNSDRCSA